MVLFIIFGTRGVTSTKERGQFHCPHCQGTCDYVHKSVRRFFTLYFIPIIPMDHLGEYIECNRCQGTFNEQVLSYDPATTENQVQALFMVAMKQVMIGMLLADGIIDDDEVAELKATFEDLADTPVTEQDLREEIAAIQAQGSSALQLIQHLAPQLNDKGKEMVVTAAYQIAVADGLFDETEQQFMRDLGDALELTPAHFRGIMAGLEAPAIA